MKTPTPSRPLTLLFASLSLLGSGALHAQEADSGRYSIMLGGSMTGAGDMEYHGLALGEVETQRYQFTAEYEIPFGKEWTFQTGLEYERVEVDHDLGETLVPGSLTKTALTLGARWAFAENWAASASISPGFYGDDEVDFSDGFNVPFMLLGHWRASDNLSVAFGLRVNAFSDSTVMPVANVSWEINPQWELTLGVPRTELRYQWSERLSLYGGAAFEGSSYAVDSPNRVSPDGRSLRDTYLSESEIRALVGMGYTFDSGLKLSIEGGYAFDRKFDYHERDVELEVDPGAFAALSVSFSF